MLEDMKPPVKVSSCKVRDIVATLDAKDAKILLDAIKGSEWKIYQLSQALKAKGIELSESPISRHRKGTCSCSKI